MKSQALNRFEKSIDIPICDVPAAVAELAAVAALVPFN